MVQKELPNSIQGLTNSVTKTEATLEQHNRPHDESQITNDDWSKVDSSQVSWPFDSQGGKKKRVQSKVNTTASTANTQSKQAKRRKDLVSK